MLSITYHNQRQKQFSFTRSLLIVALVIWISFSVLFGKTNIVSFFGIDSIILYNCGRLLVYALLLLSIFFQTWSNDSFILFISIFVVILLSAFFSGQRVLLSILLFNMAAQYERNEKNIVRIYFYTNLVVLIITVSLAMSGLIDNSPAYRGTIQRACLGFSHPNGLAGILSLILICWYYLNWENLRFPSYAVSVILSIYIYKITNSRTQIIVLALLITGAWILHLISSPVKYRLMNLTCHLLLLTCVLITIWSMYYFEGNSPFESSLNSIFSGRFSLIRETYKITGFHLFGTSLPADSMVDNSYAWILLATGVVPFFIYLVFWICAIRIAYKTENAKLQLSICVFLLIGFLENSLFRIEANFIPLVVANNMWKKNRRNQYGA